MFCKLSANQFGGLDREWQVLYRVAQGHYEMAKKLYLKLGVRNGVLSTNHVGTGSATLPTATGVSRHAPSTTQV